MPERLVLARIEVDLELESEACRLGECFLAPAEAAGLRALGRPDFVSLHPKNVSDKVQTEVLYCYNVLQT